MATIVNARDVLLQATSPRVLATSDRYVMITAATPLFKVDTSGAPTPSSIQMTASAVGIANAAFTWSVVSGAATLTGSGSTRTLAYVDLATSSATIRASVTDNGNTYTADYTIAKVVDGAAGSTGIRGSRSLFSVNAAYTATYNNGAGAGAASYKAQATTIIAGSISAPATPTTPIKGDTVTFTNGTDYVTTYTNDGTYATNANNSWALPGTVFDGSLLVHGSVTATALAALTITAVSGVIANAAIDSLQVAGNAITAPSSGVNSSNITLTTTDQDICRAVLSSGQVGAVPPASRFVSAAMEVLPASGSPVSTETIVISLYRDTTLLVASDPISVHTNETTLLPMQWTDTAALTANTSYTYNLKCKRAGPTTNQPIVGGSSIFVIGAKR
jgi:hypothetical protein